MLKKLSSLILSLLVFCPLWSGIFFLIYCFTSFYFALTIVAILLFVTAFFLIWASSILVSKLKLKKLHEHPFVEQIRNISWRFAETTPQILLLEGEHYGIYYLRPYFGKGLIIVGEKLFETLNTDELYYINFYSFLVYKENFFRLHQNLTFICDFITWPFTRKIYEKKHFTISFLSYLLLPFLKLKNLFLKKILNVHKSKEYRAYFDAKAEYLLRCAFFKMQKHKESSDEFLVLKFLRSHQIVPLKSRLIIDELVS